MPALQGESAPAGAIAFYFCEKCGKRVTAADLARGQGRDKQLKGVHCAACAEGTQTVAFDAISQAEIWKDEQARRQGQRRSTSTRMPAANADGTAPRKRRSRQAFFRSRHSSLGVVWAVLALVLCGGVGAFFAIGLGSRPPDTAASSRSPDTNSSMVSAGNLAPVRDARPDPTASLSRTATPWTPAALTTAPVAWYDAADTGTIVQSSGVVSQWKDKSPSGRHLSQGTSTAMPKTGTRTIGGLNAIEFDGSNDVLLGLRNRTSAITIFGVVLTDAGSGTDANRAWLSSPGGSNPDYWMTAQANSDTQGAMMEDSRAAYSGATASATRSAAHIHAAYSWVAGGANGGVRVDGGAASGSIATKPNALQQAATELAIGRQKNVAGRFHDGLVGEVIIINARLTEADADFLKIEGYLAHKWGLAANLPAGHPYKNAAPTLP